MDAVKEAIEFWQEKTSLEPVYIYKGMNNLTEMYSAIEAEVPLDNDIHTQANMELVAKLKEADKVDSYNN